MKCEVTVVYKTHAPFVVNYGANHHDAQLLATQWSCMDDVDHTELRVDGVHVASYRNGIYEKV